MIADRVTSPITSCPVESQPTPAEASVIAAIAASLIRSVPPAAMVWASRPQIASSDSCGTVAPSAPCSGTITPLWPVIIVAASTWA